MISVYHSAFNLNKHGFTGWQECLRRSCEFADQVVVAVNTSEDDTHDIVSSILKESAKSSILLKTSFNYQDPWLDGKIKNAALIILPMPIVRIASLLVFITSIRAKA